jgi:hypothetical protein
LTLGLEDNNLSPRSVEPLLRAMRAGSALVSLTLDMQHGAEFSKVRTAKKFMANKVLTMLAASNKKESALMIPSEPPGRAQPAAARPQRPPLWKIKP